MFQFVRSFVSPFLWPFSACNFCSSSDHSTYVCPVLSQGEHVSSSPRLPEVRFLIVHFPLRQVKDTSTDNLSRSSVPHGLQVLEDESGTHIVSMQKFAKGCRFGPLLAPKSYIHVVGARFPLSIFGTMQLDVEAMDMPELKELFKVRTVHLDTRNEKYCNWMVHVDPARYANEQSLVAYEEENEIFFAAVEDLDVGDMLKVWYAPKYGEQMKAPPLGVSPFPVSKNILQQGRMLLPEYQLFSNYGACDSRAYRTEISLPSIKTIIKPSAYVCYENRPGGGLQLDSTYEHSNGRHSDGHAAAHRFESRILNLDEPFPFAVAPPAHSAELFGSFDEDDGPVGAFVAAEKDEKKVYPCQLCDKKYSTMTNIYRHVRTQHNYFLCSLCMNMFQLEAELKEHIHKCPKSDVKKPQCVVCMQYFSNSWSLTRHIKIHVSAGEW